MELKIPHSSKFIRLSQHNIIVLFGAELVLAACDLKSTKYNGFIAIQLARELT